MFIPFVKAPSAKAATRIVQFAALALLLVTSRETGRWVIPKGWPIRLKSRRKVAALNLMAGKRAKVGTAYGYSTLWMALGQPDDGAIVTIDPDRNRTDLAREWWRQAGIADERIGHIGLIP